MRVHRNIYRNIILLAALRAFAHTSLLMEINIQFLPKGIMNYTITETCLSNSNVYTPLVYFTPTPFSNEYIRLKDYPIDVEPTPSPSEELCYLEPFFRTWIIFTFSMDK